MGRKSARYRLFLATSLVLGIAALSGCDGVADMPKEGTHLGDSVIDPGSGGGGGSRSDIDPGRLYTVTKIVSSTTDIPAWTNSDLPFTGPRRVFGDTTTNSQWPFEFNYTYPANNFALTEAHLFLVTSRDSSDTEAIFTDGIFTGRPPASDVSTTSTKFTDVKISCSGGSCPIANTGPANTFFMDFALSHYAIGTDNTFDINLDNLISGTSHTITSLLSDGNFKVVSGDDAAIKGDTATTSAPLLVMVGSTYSTTPLTCSTSPNYLLRNTYLHNDGNSISQPAFSGTVLSPFNSWSSVYSTFRSVEFYFDPSLPKLTSYDQMTITKANITMMVKRSSSDPTAAVINGIGIDQDNFDRTKADSTVVESWVTDATARAAYNTFINSIPANSTSQTVTVDLLTLLGADTVKTLLLQGKLNVALAGPIARVSAGAPSANRTYGVAVSGPQLVLEGDYAAEICEVPDNANSPLNGGGGSTGPSICTGPDADVVAPTVSSIQVINITASSATIQWLTSLEGSTTQVGYGLLSPNSLTTVDSNLANFHSVNITGLSPYKYYQYNVRSVDACGNETISATKSFRTLR
jgi:hypothetical protein